jgi:hypothetical protein
MFAGIETPSNLDLCQFFRALPFQNSQLHLRLVLLGFAAVFFMVAIWRFKFD